MAFTLTGATAIEPKVPGSRRRWVGTVTVDNTYANGTGFTIPATSFGLTNVDQANMSMSQNILFDAVFISGGANLVFKCIVNTTGAELASTVGSGAIFPVEVFGI